MGPHFKKTVTLDHGGRRLELGVAQELFSSHEVDVGTRLLLRTLAGPEHASRRRVLDLGCGYGPLGLALRAAAADRVVHLVDRDALAVEYSRENAARNRLDDVEVYGSLGYADVRGSGFDLIVSNIPAKAGPPVIEQLLLGGAALLAPGGLVAVVVIAPLRASVTAVLEGAPEVEVVFRRATASYAVFHYRFRAPPATPDELGVYERGRLTVTHAGVSVRLRTAWGLPEFDALGVPTRLVADALLRPGGRPPRTALVLHPGQGHLPCLLWAGRRPAELRLVDRDLLALRFSQANLVANGCPVEGRHRPPGRSRPGRAGGRRPGRGHAAPQGAARGHRRHPPPARRRGPPGGHGGGRGRLDGGHPRPDRPGCREAPVPQPGPETQPGGERGGAGTPLRWPAGCRGFGCHGPPPRMREPRRARRLRVGSGGPGPPRR
jgi:16S rRNA G1207 methylase RsmC